MSKLVIYHRKITLLTARAIVIKVEMSLVKFTSQVSTEFPEGYKFRWMAYNVDNPDKLLRFDNHTGKFPHWHDNGQEGELEWLGLEKTEQLFFQKVKSKFGYFDFDN
ncbi:protein of unknown function [endosymbiont DhMRE of Dentiscutata heterogama]|uniref:hypothetical protein n=1 Tax=endosymbiont DhMRE of Dentiscutata heterogama TaxID=1609546 RepID=UPI000636E10E|nr:hypothetical protein [endosymbiont DhMRE of Dentiscutata heterogama]CFW92737.1 protein of unknown function [endosymbiont DhMRE of Dentiscutata heterogama]